MGIYRLLDGPRRVLLEEQRALVQRARRVAQQVGIRLPHTPDGVLDESFFTVVVAGEFNSGKSTLVNALLGARLLEVGHLPTTDCITILRHMDGESSEDEDSTPPALTGVVRHNVDLPLLRDMNLVDTPGTNALTNHTSRTLSLLPKADCILFVTSAERPFPESERKVIEAIQQYRKSITIVINKMDTIETSGGDHGAAEKQRLVGFVAEHASDLLGANPSILAVSARDALAAKLTSPRQEHEQAALWRRSNFAALELFLRDTLTTETKLKAKLLNPIGLAEGWINECQTRLSSETSELEADRITLSLLSSQLEAWKQDMQSEMDRARRGLHQRLCQEGQRAHILLQRLGKASDFLQATLVDPALLSREWRKTQVAVNAHKHETMRAELHGWIQETADNMAMRGRAQGQAVIEFLGHRPSSRNKSLVGNIMTASNFAETRDSLQRRMESALERLVLDENLEHDEQHFLGSLQATAKTSSILLSISAVSVGAAYVQLLDLTTGLGLGTVLTLSGIFLLSNGRTKACDMYEAHWSSRDQSFQKSLRIILEEELHRIEQHIEFGITPYTRFVEADENRIDRLTTECQELLIQAQQLRKQINQSE